MLNKLKYISAALITVAGCTTATVVGHSTRIITLPKEGPDFAKTSVTITNFAHNSGGTGNILDSRPGLTRILTNKHICELIQVGGLVVTDAGEQYPVESYQVYTKHDLCMISIFKNLGVNLKLASGPPKTYTGSTVVGHPHLLPTMITTGHFSQWRTISMMVGGQPCDGHEQEPDVIVMCMFYGMKPVIQQFQTQVTTSLIQPGSSGSAVYNENGELSGVIFAGQGDLSYGYMVPWEYVNDFITHLNRYPNRTPNPLKQPENFFQAYFKFEKDCKSRREDTAVLCSALATWGIHYE